MFSANSLYSRRKMKANQMDNIKIGNVTLEKSAALAPMAGVADRVYRLMCREYGAAYTVSEMVSAKGICYSDKKTAELCTITEGERPMGIQLFGYEADFMAEAVKIVLEYNPDIIDINMGCPVPKVVNTGAGSALMKNPKLAAEITEAAVKAAGDVPVTVKIRSGWSADTINAVEMAKAAEFAGAAAIAVHGRTRDMFYSGTADYSVIKAVKDAVKIPVIGNGDITDGESCLRMYRETGCDLVMIGRAALGNPFIFKELCGQKQDISFKQKMDTVIRLSELESKNKGEHLGILELRRHLPFFFKGLRGAAEFRRRATSVNSIDDVILLTRDAQMHFEEENK